jgi:hypothetical protein
MKTISQFAKVCGVEIHIIRSIMKRDSIIPRNHGIQSLDKNQQDIIARILYFEGKIEYLTFESKMNDVCPNYENRNDFIKLGYITNVK